MPAGYLQETSRSASAPAPGCAASSIYLISQAEDRALADHARADHARCAASSSTRSSALITDLAHAADQGAGQVVRGQGHDRRPAPSSWPTTWSASTPPPCSDASGQAEQPALQPRLLAGRGDRHDRDPGRRRDRGRTGPVNITSDATRDRRRCRPRPAREEQGAVPGTTRRRSSRPRSPSRWAKVTSTDHGRRRRRTIHGGRTVNVRALGDDRVRGRGRVVAARRRHRRRSRSRSSSRPPTSSPASTARSRPTWTRTAARS